MSDELTVERALAELREMTAHRYHGIDRTFHECELADKRDSALRSEGCWRQFPCRNNNDCKGERFCPPCLDNVVAMSAELMSDY